MQSKAQNLLAVGLAATLAVGLAPARAREKATDANKSNKTEGPPLQLAVEVPAQWRPFLSDDLAEAFASRVSEVFRRAGFRGSIRFLDGNKPEADLPLLALHVLNWRVGAAEHAECTFTASLKIAGNEHDLGIIEQSNLMGPHKTGRLDLVDALGDVANEALHILSSRLLHSDLLSGRFAPTQVEG